MSQAMAEIQLDAAPGPRPVLQVTAATLELLALAIWIGGLVVIVASVIPAVFNSFGMEAGGRFLTRVFVGYNRLITLSSAVLLVIAGWRLWAGRRTPALGLSWTEVSLTALLLGLAGLIILVLGPDSIRLQEEAFAAKDEVARQAAYTAFFRMHHVVRALYVINLGLAIAVAVVKIRRWVGGAPSTRATPMPGERSLLRNEPR